MKLKAIYFSNGSYATVRSEAVFTIKASDKISLELDLTTNSVAVDDRGPNGEGQYNVPLACLRRWERAEEPKSVKKAAGQ